MFIIVITGMETEKPKFPVVGCDNIATISQNIIYFVINDSRAGNARRMRSLDYMGQTLTKNYLTAIQFANLDPNTTVTPDQTNGNMVCQTAGTRMWCC